MSSGARDQGAALRAGLRRELRQFYGLGASLYRAAAARISMTVTDLQVVDLLESSGPSTAGQLADLTGLTTGAITGMLNRLEEAGLVRRERDPEDGRRVIVRLARGKDDGGATSSMFASLEQGWDEMVSRYDEEQLALLLAFLQRTNMLTRTDLLRLREAPAGERGVYSAAVGGLESARLVVSCGNARLAVRANEGMAELYQARFEGPAPDVAAKEGVVTIRYPRRLWGLGAQRTAEVSLNVAVPWRIAIQGNAVEVNAELERLDLAGLEVKGGYSMIRLELPAPSRIVPVRIGGGASEVTVRRPVGVAARVHLKGWVSTFVFDDQTFSTVGNDVRLQSPGYDATAPHYDIEVSSSASTVTITTD